jgi:hypothetical protein
MGKEDFHPADGPLSDIIAMDRLEGKTSLVEEGVALRIGINQAPES